MARFDMDGIKRRREERLRRLREQMEDTYSSYFFEDSGELPPVYKEPIYRQREWEEPWERYGHKESSSRSMLSFGMSHKTVKRRDKLFIKIIASFFLLSLAYVINNVSFPGAEKYRTVMNEVMHRSYDFAGMSAWYEKNFGSVPTLLPNVGGLGNEVQPVLRAQNMLLKAPASGKVVQTFAEQGSGIYFTPGETSIRAVDQGWVTFVGQKEGLGNTVIIQHAKGMETWYAGLAEVEVKQNDWVEIQHTIGKAAKEGHLINPVYFAVKKNGQFVNPQDVVHFE
ncbi:peptidoglycan DD-metalloendopeptidase family protein [Aneurinibacillus thermoaerophilus]|uniref:M23 family metallopeptidase n=1 Tax=Aneurinibacillus thermoaerophilus TaxID=143495 RepID=A0ABX8Y8V9_ANETH|nr:M23 family metallopeptidase [Aneurinibacillus thermoaerophilus]QYY42105.1 M23 family metallopeptidase [Aneurinibacillus thermoaerophilus]